MHRSLLPCILLFLMLSVGFLQIYIGTVHTKTFHHQFHRDATKRKHRRESTLQASSNSIISVSNNKNHTDVIVYLAQFGKFHTSYGLQKDANKETITGLSKLNKSLKLLYINYVNDFHSCDILIFYDTEHGPDNETMIELKRNRPQLQFRELRGKWWSLPHGLKAVERFTWNRPAFR